MIVEVQSEEHQSVGLMDLREHRIVVPIVYAAIDASPEKYQKTVFVKQQDNRWFAFDPYSLQVSDAVYDEASIKRYRELESVCGQCLEKKTAGPKVLNITGPPLSPTTDALMFHVKHRPRVSRETSPQQNRT